MAREFAKPFYNSKAWKSFRQSYIDSMPIEKKGLCEKCFEKGKHERGEELHHLEWLNESNITNPEITLNKRKVILLCRECHMRIHDTRKERVRFDSMGNLISNE